MVYLASISYITCKFEGWTPFWKLNGGSKPENMQPSSVRMEIWKFEYPNFILSKSMFGKSCLKLNFT